MGHLKSVNSRRQDCWYLTCAKLSSSQRNENLHSVWNIICGNAGLWLCPVQAKRIVWFWRYHFRADRQMRCSHVSMAYVKLTVLPDYLGSKVQFSNIVDCWISFPGLQFFFCVLGSRQLKVSVFSNLQIRLSVLHITPFKTGSIGKELANCPKNMTVSMFLKFLYKSRSNVSFTKI